MIDEKQDEKRRGVSLYKENPFLSQAALNTKQGVKRITDKSGSRMMVVSSSTGEVVAPAGFWQIEEVDRSQFVKLYINGVKAFADLTNAGAKVFAVMYSEMQKNIGKDIVYLSFSGVDQDMFPLSSATYGRGLRELVEKKFLAASMVQGRYFINPDFMFNGDRLALVKEFRVKGASPKLPADVADRDELERRGQQRLLE